MKCLLNFLCVSAFLFFFNFPAYATPSEADYQQFLKEIRCVVCQNQSLAESDAKIAGDMRIWIREQIAEGKSLETIQQDLMERFGEFISFRPTFSLKNLLLWCLPLVFLLLAFLSWLKHLRWGE